MPDERQYLAALRSWREHEIEGGAGVDGLPTAADLETVARTAVDGLPTNQSLLQLPVRDGATWMNRWGGALWGVLRAVRDQGAAGGGPDAGSATTAGKTPDTAPPPFGGGPLDVAGYSRSSAAWSSASTDGGNQADTASGLAAQVSNVAFPTFRVADSLDYSAPPAFEGPSVTVTVDDDNRLEIRWPGMDDEREHAAYRVVVSDDHFSFAPEDGPTALVLHTEPGSPATVAWAAPTSPIRTAAAYVTVWRYAGADAEARATATPTLHVRAAVVVPPREVSVTEDEGHVVGSWRYLPRTDRIDVLRIPEEDAYDPSYQGRYRLSADRVLLDGFRDAGATAGRTHEYRCYAVAMIAGRTVWSTPVIRRVHIKPRLAFLNDVKAEVTGDERPEIEVSWPTSGSSVLLFRTHSAPPNDIQGREYHRTELALHRLTDESLMRTSVRERPDGRTVAAGIAWPQGWPLVHLTAVAVDGDRVLIGSTATVGRASRITQLEIAQRFNSQLLKFAWPADVETVHVFATPPGVALADHAGEPLLRIGRERYRHQGGARVRIRGPLAAGCDLHVVPLYHHGGDEVRGAPSVLHYRGLLRLVYKLEPIGGFKAKMSRMQPRQLLLMSDQEQPPRGLRVGVVVIHNTERLPLDRNDGREVKRAEVPVPGRQYSPVLEFEVDRREGGYLRAFIDSDPVGAEYDVALKDHSLACLVVR